MLERIRVEYFIGAFALGFLFVYLSAPQPQIVMKFPSPYNQDQVYKDKNNTCYKYQATPDSCPVDKDKVKAQPIVEDFSR